MLVFMATRLISARTVDDGNRTAPERPGAASELIDGPTPQSSLRFTAASDLFRGSLRYTRAVIYETNPGQTTGQTTEGNRWLNSTT